jgi:hypothetical protein
MCIFQTDDKYFYRLFLFYFIPRVGLSKIMTTEKHNLCKIHKAPPPPPPHLAYLGGYTKFRPNMFYTHKESQGQKCFVHRRSTQHAT